MNSKKDDAISEKYRLAGNNFFGKGNYFLALIAYNKSICYASSKELLALAYANRASAYKRGGKYEESIQTIKLARENYPKDKIQKLNEREEKCKKLMRQTNNNQIPNKYFQLSYPANSQNPNVAGCLELRSGIFFTTRCLKPGDVVLIEDSFFKFLPQLGYVNRCYNCFKANSMNLIPSLENAVTMFCSVKCRDAGYNDNDSFAKKEIRQLLLRRLKHDGLSYDFCPIYDEGRSFINMPNDPFAHCDNFNTSYFRYDGNKQIYYITRPVKAGEQLTRNHHPKINLIEPTSKRTFKYFNCECFHCKLELSIDDFLFNTKCEMPAELLTATEMLEKLTENWKRIEKISDKTEIYKLIEDNRELMELLAIKKTYLPKGRYCFCRTCALNAVKIYEFDLKIL